MSINTTSCEPYQRVEDQYAGRSVFITGGTGFMGKVFIEKLLYSCPKLDKIFLLLRDKEKSDPKKRIEQLLELPIFQRLKNERPEALYKIVPVKGDVGLLNLGLSDEDREMLIEEVSYVFHFAANIKFNEPLKHAMHINVEGTRRVLHLSRLIKNIKGFVYISTAFSHSEQKVLEEYIYPSTVSIDDVYKILKQGENNQELIKKLLVDKPNTYTFTKALAENVVNEEHGDVPTVIIRPSIVAASYNEPLKGWLDNWFGGTFLISSISTGLIKIILNERSTVTDLIPVDYVSNLTVVAAAKCNRSGDVKVYNSCTSAANPVTIGNLYDFLLEDHAQNNQKGSTKPSVIFTQQEWFITIYTTIMQIIPAFLVDCWLRLTGKRPRFLKLQRKILYIYQNLRYFTSRTWNMRCDRTSELFATLSVSDRIEFPFDPAQIVWTKYVPIYYKGIREHLFKSK
ncbi:putative fatty acyl-CoA reductase CG5065 [Battus philenor]|uniref:putative fatty acyl-CoA reductase CG5065 n=1 Tax=Battus philenor TaxID=42288 RepID=UPI0035D0F6FD